MSIKNNEMNSSGFMNFVASEIITLGYTCTDLIILPFSEYIDELKKFLLQNTDKPALISPRVTTIQTLYNSQIDIADFCANFNPIEQTIVDDLSLAMLISKSFCSLGINMKFLDSYTIFLRNLFEHSPAYNLDNLFESLLTNLKEAIGTRNPVYKITENLFHTFKQEKILPIILAQKIILTDMQNNFDLGKNKLFIVRPKTKAPKFIEAFFDALAAHHNCYVFTDEPNQEFANLSNHYATYIECENEVDQQHIVYFIARELIENGKTNLSLICQNSVQEKYIASTLDKYGITTSRETTLFEQSYSELFITIFRVLTQDSLTALELSAILKHQTSKFLNHPSVKLLEKNYLRKPLGWKTLDDLLNLIDEKDTAIKELLNEFIHWTQLLKATSFKKLIEANLQIFKSIYSHDAQDYNPLENFLHKINRFDYNFTISKDDYLELICNQLKQSKLNASSHSSMVKFHTLDKAINIEADAYIITNFNEGTFPPNFNQTNLIGEKAENYLGIPSIESRQEKFSGDLQKLLSKNVYIIRPKNSDGEEKIVSRFLDTIPIVKEKKYNDWFKDLYFNHSNFLPSTHPAPNPELAQRPKRISLSGIEKLIRDPYAYYAEYILKLRKLEPIGVEINNREFGSTIHTILSRLIAKGQDKESYMKEFTKQFKELFKYAHGTIQTLFETRVNNISASIYEYETNQDNVIANLSEAEGEINIETIKVTARADRIDRFVDNSIEILDYKTGFIPSKSSIMDGSFPQLAIEALIAERGGFGFDTTNARIKYISIKGRDDSLDTQEFTLDSKVTEESLTKLVEHFLISKNQFYIAGDSDGSIKVEAYEHLARREEWNY